MLASSYIPSKGLGKYLQGITKPISAAPNLGRHGLGYPPSSNPQSSITSVYAQFSLPPSSSVLPSVSPAPRPSLRISWMSDDPIWVAQWPLQPKNLRPPPPWCKSNLPRVTSSLLPLLGTPPFSSSRRSPALGAYFMTCAASMPPCSPWGLPNLASLFPQLFLQVLTKLSLTSKTVSFPFPWTLLIVPDLPSPSPPSMPPAPLPDITGKSFLRAWPIVLLFVRSMWHPM